MGGKEGGINEGREKSLLLRSKWIQGRDKRLFQWFQTVPTVFLFVLQIEKACNHWNYRPYICDCF